MAVTGRRRASCCRRGWAYLRPAQRRSARASRPRVGARRRSGDMTRPRDRYSNTPAVLFLLSPRIAVWLPRRVWRTSCAPPPLGCHRGCADGLAAVRCCGPQALLKAPKWYSQYRNATWSDSYRRRNVYRRRVSRRYNLAPAPGLRAWRERCSGMVPFGIDEVMLLAALPARRFAITTLASSSRLLRSGRARSYRAIAAPLPRPARSSFWVPHPDRRQASRAKVRHEPDAYESARPRLQRSELAVPGSNRRCFAKRWKRRRLRLLISRTGRPGDKDRHAASFGTSARLRALRRSPSAGASILRYPLSYRTLWDVVEHAVIGANTFVCPENRHRACVYSSSTLTISKRARYSPTVMASRFLIGLALDGQRRGDRRRSAASRRCTSASRFRRERACSPVRSGLNPLARRSVAPADGRDREASPADGLRAWTVLMETSGDPMFSRGGPPAAVPATTVRGYHPSQIPWRMSFYAHPPDVGGRGHSAGVRRGGARRTRRRSTGRRMVDAASPAWLEYVQIALTRHAGPPTPRGRGEGAQTAGPRRIHGHPLIPRERSPGGFGVPVPAGGVAYSAGRCLTAPLEIGVDRWVV